jgi:hypothetical protein
MKYRDFEIRRCTGTTAEVHDYELVKWNRRDNGEPPYSLVLAWLDKDKRDGGWNFSSFGMRFIDYCEDGLVDYVKWYLHILEMIWQDADKGE